MTDHAVTMAGLLVSHHWLGCYNVQKDIFKLLKILKLVNNCFEKFSQDPKSRKGQKFEVIEPVQQLIKYFSLDVLVLLLLPQIIAIHSWFERSFLYHTLTK